MGEPAPVAVPQFNQYQALEVAAGPYCTFAVGRHQNRTVFEDEEHRDILNELKKILLKDGTLIRFFTQKQNSLKGRGTLRGRRGTSASAASKAPIDDEEEANQLNYMRNIDPYTQEITRKEFCERIFEAKFCKTLSRAKELAKVISDHGGYKSEGHNLDATLLNLGDVEDFALGFLQHNTKIFLFGQFHKALGCFESKVEEQGDNQDNFMKMQIGGKNNRFGAQGGSDLRIVSNPTAVLFPKFTKPMMSVACGSAHALALTIDQEMFSWGCGSYGALGFGFREDQPSPQRLDINDHKGQKYKISAICCGKFHSMCLTSRQNIMTWGEGSNGRLGHGDGNEEDQLVPKEIYTLSQRKPISISAGESHSAAITEKLSLFTWGNGGFGRLGHGTDTKEYSPKIVEGLLHEEIVYVSCGSFHTLTVTKQGHVYVCGQNKYGKLGIHPQNSSDGEVHKEPVRISVYKVSLGTRDVIKEKGEIVQACAGFNHSLVLSKEGKAYSFGYNGKGVLGRHPEHFRVPLPVGQGYQFVQNFKTGGNSFIRAIQESAMEFRAQQQVAKGKKKQFDELVLKQAICGAVNTLALSSAGDVYVLGDNTYGQHAKEKLEAKNTEANQIFAINDPTADQPIPYQASIIEFPFHTQDKIEYVACGGEHLFAQSALDEIYGWGRNDEGQIGVGFLTEKIVEPMFIKDLSYKGIRQISCSDNYSAALTIYGEVYVAGSLEGGKLGLGKGQKRGYQLNFRTIQNIPEIDFIATGVSHMLAISRYNPDPEPGSKAAKLNGKTYAWGKNQRGQLGIGTKENQYSPCMIENTKERFKKVACGTNFSVGLSHTHRVYFWGNFKYYCSHKVTKDIEEPIIMNQLEQNEVHDITADYKYVAALIDKGEIRQWGKFLLDKQQKLQGGDDKDKKGKKKKKGDEEKGESETKIEAISKFPASSKFNILFESLNTGANHTLAISTSQKVYVWGHNNVNNRLGMMTTLEAQKARIEPVPLASLQNLIEKQKENNMAINAAAANMKTAGADAEESGMEFGGGASFRQDVMEVESIREEEKEEEDGAGALALGVELGGDAEGEPQDNPEEGEREMKGPDGTRGGGGGGAPGSRHEKTAGAAQPQNQSVFEQISRREAQVAKKKQQATGKISSTEFTQLIVNDISNFNKNIRRAKLPKKPQQELNIFDENVDLFVLEFIRQEMHRKQQPALVQLIPNTMSSSSLVNSNILLQKILKKEEAVFEDEKAIIKLDVEIVQSVKEILVRIIKFGKHQTNNTELQTKIKQSFLGRVPEAPFFFDSTLTAHLKMEGMIPELVEHKKAVKQILYFYTVHPCYIIRLLKSGLMSFEDSKLLIKQLYSQKKRTGKTRMNYLLISVFKAMLNHELSGPLDNVDLYSKDSRLICGYIFRRIFKSQQTNVDTICCIVAHIINLIVSSIQAQGNSADGTFDVEDSIGGGGDKGGKGQGGGKSATKKALDLVEFVKVILDSIMNNSVLKDQVVYFSFRKKVMAQLEFVKMQFKEAQEEKINALGNQQPPMNNDTAKSSSLTTLAGLEADQIRDRFPSIRFSEEVQLLLTILQTHLKQMECQGSREELVTSHILGLIFQAQVSKVWDSYEIFLFPYLQKIKLLNIAQDSITKVHQTNIKNVIETLLAFMTGKVAFQNSESENWNKELNQKLSQLQQTMKTQLLNKIMKYGREISSVIPFKNFELQLIHSLEQDDTQLCISKKLLGTLIVTIFDNKKSLSIQNPMKNDPLIKVMETLDAPGIGKLRDAAGYEEKLTFKLKTRLFVPNAKLGKVSQEGQLSQYGRCLFCDAILLKDVAVQNYDENLVQSHYEPQDKQSLVNQYCDIIRNVPSIASELSHSKGGDKDRQGGRSGGGGIHGRMRDFIKKASTTARRNADYKISDKIQDFQKKLDIEVENLKNKQAMEQKLPQEQFGGGPNQTQQASELDEDAQYEEQVLWTLVREAEKKIHERVRQKFNLMLIQKHIDQFLQNHINSRSDHFKSYIIPTNQQVQQNYQYGLANRDMIHLTSSSAALAKMAAVQNFVASQSKSESLSKGLKADQKAMIRGYLRLDAGSLLSNGTIVKVSLNELNPLMSKSQVVLIESEDGQKIDFKLVFRDTKFNLCGPDTVLQEHTLLQFEIQTKQLKQIRQKIVEQSKKEKEPPKKPQKGQEQNEETDDILTFPENDALGFNHEKFLSLLTQMERQKAAYILAASEEAGNLKRRK